MVLCVHGSEDYKKAFESFMKKYLAVNVEWVNRPPQNEKYLVLCNVVSRIPEDIEWVFESLDLKGNTRLLLKYNVKNIKKGECHMIMFYII